MGLLDKLISGIGKVVGEGAAEGIKKALKTKQRTLYRLTTTARTTLTAPPERKTRRTVAFTPMTEDRLKRRSVKCSKENFRSIR